jgi:RimJ/RimL family protein N-acetyltransferase
MTDDIWTGETIVTTERLILRLFRRADVPLYQAICADPDVMQFLGGVWSADRTEATMGRANAGARSGEGMVAVERRSDGAFLGAAGLGVEEQWYPHDLQVGWRLIPAYWGHGYATEAGRAWLGYGFETLGHERLIAMADTPNRRSIAVMQRLGMTYDHEARLRDGDDEFDATIYAMARSAWHR